MPLTDHAVLIEQLRKQAQSNRPSLTREEFADALHAVLGRHKGGNLTVGKLQRLVEEELAQRYGEPTT